MIDWKKYLFAFGITALIFATAIYVSNYLGQRKIDDIKSIQDKISIDILSSETQFSLLEESSCKDIASSTSSALSQELSSLEDRLSYTEKGRPADDPQVLYLKRYYSLLEIKDYLLMQKVSDKCHTSPLTIIYFYSNTGDCPDCEREGYVLTHMRDEYPSIRVYSFDYNLDLSALKTLIAMNKVKGNLPVILINDRAYYGFQSVDALEAVPEIKKVHDAMAAAAALKEKSTSASSTNPAQ